MYCIYVLEQCINEAINDPGNSTTGIKIIKTWIKIFIFMFNFIL